MAKCASCRSRRRCPRRAYPSSRAEERTGERGRPVAGWLFACCALVFAMIVVGGVTRLTHSGLSIVEWQPIVGTLPPLFGCRVAADVCEISADARVPPGQPRDDARRVQGHLLVGILRTGSSGARSASCSWCRCLHLLASRTNSATLRRRARCDLRARRAAGRNGLVHGAKRPRRRPARVAVPAYRASRARASHLRGDVLARAVADISGA